jgi:hypothetical protein
MNFGILNNFWELKQLKNDKNCRTVSGSAFGLRPATLGPAACHTRQGVASEHRWGPGVARQGAVGRRGAVAVDGSGAGTVVTDDGALALHHREGESEVRWGRD